MSHLADLLHDLEVAGLSLRREGKQLLVSPREKVTDEQRSAIRTNKPGLIRALAIRAAMDAARQSFVEEMPEEGPAVRMVEKVVLLWDDGETAMVFDREFIETWREWNQQARKRRAGDGCPHNETEFGQVISERGTVQVMERCAACKANVRGVGKWVPGRDLPASRDTLPVFRDARGNIARDLFSTSQ